MFCGISSVATNQGAQPFGYVSVHLHQEYRSGSCVPQMREKAAVDPGEGVAVEAKGWYDREGEEGT